MHPPFNYATSCGMASIYVKTMDYCSIVLNDLSFLCLAKGALFGETNVYKYPFKKSPIFCIHKPFDSISNEDLPSIIDRAIKFGENMVSM